MRRAAVLSAIPLVVAAALFAADAPQPAYQAAVKPASDEALRVMAKFRVPDGLKVELWAAEPMLANPVALAVDEKGQVYVAETFRHSQGVPDIRGHMAWLDDDLACRTVADRLALYKKHLGDRFDTYATHHDRVRLVVDSDGDGKADKATVFAEGFNSHVTGIGAGVLARHGKVWYTCIPDLWLLQDTKGTGTADVRKSLSTGYGVHTGFIGHDLHGLRMGPDGKLYYSVGDRGANVSVPDRRTVLNPDSTVRNPDSGAVFRCNPDGTELELFATGLRNPQELAFNEFGDLFTCDNNSDGGDRARWVHVVEGGDSGWRIGYQFINQPVARGPWNAEKLWQPLPANTGAASLPPLFNFSDGPSGLTYDPGTGMPDSVRGRFFLCDFRGGTSGRSGVWAVQLKQKGATYELAEAKEFFWSVLPTDCDFGPDGALYVSDWTEGWSLPGKGRVYRVVDPKFQGSALQKEVQSLLAEGMDKRPIAELTKLLGHADQRVRQEAQFALAAKGKEAVESLNTVAKSNHNRLARIHAIWGLGQIGHKEDAARAPILALVKDGDSEIRAQVARVIGWNHWMFFSELADLMEDSEPRVRFSAAVAYGRIPKTGGVSAGSAEWSVRIPKVLRGLLVDNADRDPYLRHAAVMALQVSWFIDRDKLAGDESASVRLAALLAERHAVQGLPGVMRIPSGIARFLSDKDPRLVLEAARAIHDTPIPEGEPQLAALITRPNLPDPLSRRVLVANYRQGTSANALAVVKFATRTDVSEALRLEALDLLGTWAKPSGRDRITGLWRPLPERPATVAAGAVKSVLPELLRGPDLVRVQAAALCGKLGLTDAGPALDEMFADRSLVPQARAEALKSLAAMRSAGWVGSVERAVTDPEPLVRLAALEVAARLNPETAVKLLETAAERGSVPERQVAVNALGNVRGPGADPVVGKLLDQLLAGQVPPEVRLDVLTAAGKRRTSADIRDKLAKYEAVRPKSDPLAEWRETMAGGDVERGKTVFFDKQEVACQRCHRVGNDGGEVGPNVSDVGKRLTREQILESIVLPNKQIAQGFDTAVLTMKNGKQVAGVVKSDTAKELVIMTAEGATLHLPKDQIDTRERGDSAMPADAMKYLSKTELRDLVEYLAGQKAEVR